MKQADMDFHARALRAKLTGILARLNRAGRIAGEALSLRDVLLLARGPELVEAWRRLRELLVECKRLRKELRGVQDARHV